MADLTPAEQEALNAAWTDHERGVLADLDAIIRDGYSKFWDRAIALACQQMFRKAFASGIAFQRKADAATCRTLFADEEAAGDVDPQFPQNAWTAICARAIEQGEPT